MNNPYKTSADPLWLAVSIVAILAIVIAIFVFHPFWLAEVEQNVPALIVIGVLLLVGVRLLVWLFSSARRSCAPTYQTPGTMYQEAMYGYPPPSVSVRRSRSWPVFSLLGLLILAASYSWPWLSSQAVPLINQLVAHSTSSVSPNIASGYDSVVGDPDLSASFVNHVLAVAGSPASDLGPTLYQLSINYHIKTSFALGVFHHESTYGLNGVARVTHSLGNIVCTPGWSRCYGRFRSYASWADGAADFYKLIKDEYIAHGRNTLTSILPVYAPSSDGNNPSSYIQAIQQDASQWAQGKV